VREVGLPYRPVEVLARMLLRRVHSAEETAELAGISDTAGVAVHHLIALNTFLDALMGCTSGGARISEERNKESGEEEERMLHFRTLDWGMDELRRLLVRLEFVKDGERVGSNLTYVGFVGVLTGVRFVHSDMGIYS